jgi:hypothetical protein
MDPHTLPLNRWITILPLAQPGSHDAVDHDPAGRWISIRLPL